MSKMLSLKVQPRIFEESEEVIAELDIPRNRYINEALDFYNKWNRRQFAKQQLHKEAKAITSDSLQVLHEFEELEDTINE